jgi:isopentenyl phosphate kinase
MQAPATQHSSLVFLKVGGSLITDKQRPRAPRPEVLERLAGEIGRALKNRPQMRLVLGNGAGSFGHVTAKKYGTRQGVHSVQEWQGFAEIWHEAAALNTMVTDALQAAGLPAIALHPCAAVIAEDGKVLTWDLAPIRHALSAGLLPVIHGDVIFDTRRGGTILSTEDLFDYLAIHLRPDKILLAGLEQGVWADYPACTRLIHTITPTNIQGYLGALGGSNATDVTGGMASKVLQSLELVRAIPDLQILVFSGETPGAVEQALEGASVGTSIQRAEPN